MSWLELALPLVKPYEGLHRVGPDGLIYPYLDTLPTTPVWTRGYGRTYGITADSPPITRAEAEAELAQGLNDYAKRGILPVTPNLIRKPECMAAVASWAWNCGLGAYKASRLARAIREERWSDAAQHIRTPRTSGGVEYKGLVRRREAEYALFLLGGE